YQIHRNQRHLCSGDENVGACFFGTPRRSQVTVNVRFGSEADICSAKGHVRFTPESDAECVHSNVR
ncbi:MAG: hypothetical protein WCD54_03820, partial [Pseudolabrys sp.]